MNKTTRLQNGNSSHENVAHVVQIVLSTLELRKEHFGILFSTHLPSIWRELRHSQIDSVVAVMSVV